MPYQTKIKQARFVAGPFQPEQMEQIGNALLGSVVDRIGKAVDVNDGNAKPLAARYAALKIARGLKGIRDWIWRGKTMRSLKLTSVDQNRGTIGFVDPEADKIAHIQNRRDRMFGVSPADRIVLNNATREQLKRTVFVK